MVKPRQRQLTAKAAKKNNFQNGLIDSSNSDIEVDLHGEDGWVVIKMQRITILVPAAKRSTMPKPAPSQLKAMPREVVDNQPQFPVQTCPNMPSVDEQEKSTLLAPRKGFQIARKSLAHHIPTIANPPRLEFRMDSENQDLVGTSKSQKIHGVSNTSKIIKQPRLMHGPSLVDGNTLLKHRLRASNLERKLQKAGGLSSWLASLGLGQFVRIFQGKSISKFQLVTLNMKKLKDMGAVAVGPRRKLIHAIDCVCQPYCF